MKSQALCFPAGAARRRAAAPGRIFFRASILAVFFVAFCAGSAGAASLRLSWRDNSQNESGFKIEKLVGASYVQIASLGANAQSYTDSGLTAGTSYCYRVTAFNAAGTSAASNSACATPIDAPVAQPAPAPIVPVPAPSTNPPALSPLPKWRDYQASMKIRSDDDDAIGVMFRYKDNDNYYRFSWYPQIKVRRLEKQVAGIFKTLAQDAAVYTRGQTYVLGIAAQGSSIKISIDGKTIFSVTDASFTEGSIALYSFYNGGSFFDDILVSDLATGAVLLSADFNDGSHKGWTFIDQGNDGGPSQWSVVNGALAQKSNIGSTLAGALGTYALYTRGNWQDYRATLTMHSSDDDSIGLLFRFQDPDNYYRFSWGSQVAGRRLFKRENGVFKLLAEDKIPFVPGRKYSVEVVAQGNTLKVNVDGAAVFSVNDASFRTGTVALYASYDQGAYFDDIYVEDPATKTVLLADNFSDGNFYGWTVIDEAGTIGGPSAWSVVNGEILQNANVGSDAYGSAGTYLIY